MKKFSKLLLIDDDSISNTFTSHILSKMELADELVVLLDGQKALDYIEQNCVQSNSYQGLLDKGQTPYLILLDISMPILNGFEFLKAYNEMESIYNTHIASIVVLTSSNNQADIEKALGFKVAGYLEKPLTSEKVDQVLSLILN